MSTASAVATPAQLLGELEGRYASYPEFEAALVARFNARALEFPRGYSWRDVLHWGIATGRVTRSDEALHVQGA
jgi:hypothetical protein